MTLQQAQPTPPTVTGMVVNCVAYGSSGRKLRDIAIEEISDVLQQPDDFVWVGLYEPDETMLLRLQEEFGLHDLAIEDAQHAHQRPKIEVYDDVLFCVLHTAQFVAGKVEFGETHIFLGQRFLVTVRHGASLSYAPARSRCQQEPELLGLGPSFALYAIMDFVVDNFMPITDSFQAELRELEQAIFSDQFSRDTIMRLYVLKRELVSLRLAVAPLQDILNQLMRFHHAFISEHARVYFRDVFDHAVRITDTLNTLGEMLTAALQVNLSMVAVGQNEVVKRLASWAGLLAVPTLVASIYGMNFKFMPELEWEYGYPGVIGLSLLLCALLYWRLRKSGWL